MNVLFVNYGDCLSNSINHIIPFANQLEKLGHNCIIAIPDNLPSYELIDPTLARVATYDDVLHSPYHFKNLKGAEILHAWTPRINVHKFTEEYSRKYSPSVIIHLEDNEESLIEAYYKAPYSSLRNEATRNTAKEWEKRLSHPLHYRIFINRADAFTTINKKLLQQLPKEKRKIHIYPAVSPPERISEEEKNSIKNRLRIKPDEFVTVYPGGISASNINDVATLYKAIFHLRKNGTNIKIIKTGANSDKIQDYCDFRIAEFVTDLGFIDKAEVNRLLQIADILVQPGISDKFNDYRLPSKLPEFLLSGQPTITGNTNIGPQLKRNGCCELIRKGSHTHLANHCSKLLQDKNRSKKIGKKARDYAIKTFDIQKNTKKLLKLYEKTLSTPSLRKRLIKTDLFRWHLFFAEHNHKPEHIYPVSRSIRSRPTFSIIMPVFRSNLKHLEAAINSVKKQKYQNWELYLIDDNSVDSELRNLMDREAQTEERIHCFYLKKRGNISRASNVGIKRSRGHYITFLDHDDLLSVNALESFNAAIIASPDALIVYSDEDKIDDSGNRHSPHLKTSWNPDLLENQNYICHLATIKREVIEQVGGFRPGVEGAQDWDLILRATDRCTSKQIVHVPKILYHWRSTQQSTASSTNAKPYALDASKKVLQLRSETCEKNQPLPVNNLHWTINAPRIKKQARVIRFHDCLKDHSDDSKYAINVNQLNSHINDSPQDLILLLGANIKPPSEKSIGLMVNEASRIEIATVSGKVLLNTDRIYSAGVNLDYKHIIRRLFSGYPATSDGYFQRANLKSNYTTGEPLCLLLRKSFWSSLGGFSSDQLCPAHSIIDFCFRAYKLGYRNLFQPSAIFTLECINPDDPPSESTHNMQTKWGELLKADPYETPFTDNNYVH